MVWRGRLALATGAVVLLMGVVTFNGGLELAGSPLAASRLLTATNSTSPDTAAVTVTGTEQTITISATSDGYTPAAVRARVGLPTTLVIRSNDAQGCVRAFTIPTSNLTKILPVDGETRIELGTLPAQTLNYACGMGMYTGAITAE